MGPFALLDHRFLLAAPAAGAATRSLAALSAKTGAIQQRPADQLRRFTIERRYTRTLLTRSGCRAQTRRSTPGSSAESRRYHQVPAAQYRAHPSWSAQLHYDNARPWWRAADAFPQRSGVTKAQVGSSKRARTAPPPGCSPPAAPAVARSAQLRARPCERAVAPGLPPRIAQCLPPRHLGHADGARGARRSLAALPRSMVPG